MVSELSGNHFELFGLPVRFAVSPDTLSARYRELQRSVHPDRFAGGSDQERRLSMQQATRINEAYQILKDPLRRARYLLELRGATWSDDETMADPAFLMEQMERREALEAVREQPDPLAAVGHILDQVTGDVRALTCGLEGLLSDAGGASVEQAKAALRKLQFLYKLREEAERLEADLEDEL